MANINVAMGVIMFFGMTLISKCHNLFCRDRNLRKYRTNNFCESRAGYKYFTEKNCNPRKGYLIFLYEICCPLCGAVTSIGSNLIFIEFSLLHVNW